MRILVVSGTWYPERNGVARVAVETARALAARGHEVTALVPRHEGEPPSMREGALEVRRLLERGRLPVTISDVLETAKHARRLGEPFDVLLAHGAMAAVGLARARLPAPLVFVYHASLRRELRFLRPRLPWGRERLVSHANAPIATVLERVAVGSAGRILVLSDFSRSLLEADHPRRRLPVRRVQGGVDVDFFTPGDGTEAARLRLGLDRGGPLLVSVRRAEPRMGLGELLRALALLEATDVRLAIAGGGRGEGALQRLGHELGLGERVRFLGRVGEDELRDLYRAADLFVLPTVAYEGFGMVTVEALACGTPVVGTPVGATPELLGPLDPRLLAAGSDPSSLAAAIGRALPLADAAYRARCRDYAVRSFGWAQAIGGWESALITG